MCNLFPLEFKMTSGDQILSLISMKCSPNWLLKGGVSAGGIIELLGFKVVWLLVRILLEIHYYAGFFFFAEPQSRNVIYIWFDLNFSFRNSLKHISGLVMYEHNRNATKATARKKNRTYRSLFNAVVTELCE